MGAASEFYGIWKFAKNKEAAKEFLRHYAANWPEAFKASEGYNNPCFAGLVPKPMPILSNDPTSTPHDKLAILQDSDKWSAIPGYPGPATPAMDEIYYAFIVPDMMAKAATGQLSAEDVGQVGRGAVRNHLQEVGRQGLIAQSGPRRYTRGPDIPASWNAARTKTNAPTRNGGAHPFAFWEVKWPQ